MEKQTQHTYSELTNLQLQKMSEVIQDRATNPDET